MHFQYPFMLSTAPMAYPIIGGLDFMQQFFTYGNVPHTLMSIATSTSTSMNVESSAAAQASSPGAESSRSDLPSSGPSTKPDWRSLPPEWKVFDVIISTNIIFICAAENILNPHKKKFFVGINPHMLPHLQDKFVTSAQRCHRRLLEATPEALTAAREYFTRWEKEGRIAKSASTTASTNYYIVGGDGRRHRPVFPFVWLNRHLKKLFSQEKFFQNLQHELIDRTRFFPFLTTCDFSDAYMHLALLPSNYDIFTVNLAPPNDNSAAVYSFLCMPYGPSHAPRCLEVCVHWLVPRLHPSPSKGISSTAASAQQQQSQQQQLEQHDRDQAEKQCAPEPTRQATEEPDGDVCSFMDDITLCESRPGSLEQGVEQASEEYDLPLKPSKRQAVCEQLRANILGIDYCNYGDTITYPPEKIEKLRQRSPRAAAENTGLSSCTYSDGLGILASLDETVVAHPWCRAMKHYLQSILARERACYNVPWRSHVSSELFSCLNQWHELTTTEPPPIYKRLILFTEPLHVFTDAAKHAGGFVIRQAGQDLHRYACVFRSRDTQLPICCLESIMMYRAIAHVYRWERLSHRKFPLILFHCDNRTTQLAFQSGHSTSSSAKDGSHVLSKYVALAYALYDQAEFNYRIRVVRIDTKDNPSDALTRHPLLNKIRKLEDSLTTRFPGTTPALRIEDHSDSNDEVYDDTTDDGYDDEDIIASITTACVGAPPSSFPADSSEVQTTSSTTAPPTDPNLLGLYQHQQANEELKSIYEALVARQPPPQLSGSAFRRAWSSFFVHDGLIYKKVSAVYPKMIGDTISVPLLPPSAVPILLRILHSDESRRHPGIIRLWSTLRSTVWFPGMYDAVCKHVGSCSSCKLADQRASEHRPGVQRVAPPWSWHTIAADVLSVSTPTFKQLLLVLVCLHSHFVFAIPLPDKSAHTITTKLKELVACYGPFSVLMTDRGSEFTGSETQQFLQQHGILFRPTLPYSPLSSVEQVNRTLLDRLRRIYIAHPFSLAHFPEVLQGVLWDLRLTPSSITKLPPYCIFFGRPPPGLGVYPTWNLGDAEIICDILQERRDSALARSTENASPMTFRPSQIVYCRDRRYDRQCKVANRWFPAVLLSAEGVKATLLDPAKKVIVRHVRELHPDPGLATTRSSQRLLSPSSPLQSQPRALDSDVIHVLPATPPVLISPLSSTPPDDHSVLNFTSSSSSSTPLSTSSVPTDHSMVSGNSFQTTSWESANSGGPVRRSRRAPMRFDPTGSANVSSFDDQLYPIR